MADTRTLDGIALADFDVAKDTTPDGDIQLVKLAYSANASSTHAPADADGLLVNLGANNDITGSVTLGAGTAEFGKLAAGTAAIGKLAPNSGVDIGDVDVTSIAPGTNYIGKMRITDGTTDAGVTTGGTSQGGYVALINTSGDHLDPAVEATLTGTPTLGTAINAVNDAVHATQMTFSSAALANGGRGTILGATLRDKSGTTSASIRLVLYHKSVGVQTAQSALTIADADVIERVGFIDFTTWVNGAGNSFAVGERATLPLPYKCDAGTSSIFGFFQVIVGTPTYGNSGDLSVDLEVLKVA